MYKRILLLSILTSTIIGVRAQVPEDAIRYSFFPQNGTARNLAIGGALTSLGGDINSLFINPAGLGFFKTGESVITSNFAFNNNRATFRDNLTRSDKTGIGIGPIGVVYGAPTRSNSKNSHAISFGITQTANFRNTLQYSALNNFSSYAEQWAEEVAKSGRSIDQIINDRQYAFGSGQALYTYLVDTVRVNGALQVKAAPEFILDAGQAIRQQMVQNTRGGIYEAAIGYAHNKNDKWYWGASVGIPFVFYNNNTSFVESDTSGNTNNNFSRFEFSDNFKTIGIGVNARFGLIYRPKEYIRLGIAIQTPTFMRMEDSRNTELAVKLENPVYNAIVTSKFLNNNETGQSKYTQTSPFRASISASYVFREVENTKRQRAFITADIEYVNHRGSRFGSDNEEPTADEKSYFRSLNNVVKQQYKGNFNFKVGGEVKFHTVMGRLGFAYYTSPYRDRELKANRMLLSGGIGYRNKGRFIDITYVHAISKDVHFPYRLEDRANTFATTRNVRGNIVATLGFKF
jgi:hypothetical protein